MPNALVVYETTVVPGVRDMTAHDNLEEFDMFWLDVCTNETRKKKKCFRIEKNLCQTHHAPQKQLEPGYVGPGRQQVP